MLWLCVQYSRLVFGITDGYPGLVLYEMSVNVMEPNWSITNNDRMQPGRHSSFERQIALARKIKMNITFNA